MKEEFLVSLIVAIYKSEKYIEKCITSIIGQSYRNTEIILVDDGSPDKSGKICDEFQEKDNRIIVIHQENMGACAARNNGLKIAKGEYVAIIDGDDWLEEDFVEYMMYLVKKTRAEMVFSDKIFTTRDRKQTEQDKIETWTAEEATCAIIYPHMAVGPWNKIYSRKLLNENNITFSTPWSGEGLYFAVTAAQHTDYVGVGHRKVYNYRLNNTESGLTNYKVEMGINALNNIRRIRDELIVDTKRTRNAVQWHIWKNYYFLLFLIVATNSQDVHRYLYNDCLVNMRKMMLSVAWKSELTGRSKLLIVIKSIFPFYFIEREMRDKAERLKKDNMY